MNTKILTAIAAASLALAGCSSSDSPATTADPTSSAGPTSSSAPTAIVASGDFCSAMVTATTAFDSAEMDTLQAELESALSTGLGTGDPAAVAAVNAWGDAFLSAANTSAAEFDAAAASVDDPEVAAALGTLADIYTEMMVPMAEAAANAGSVEDYLGAILLIAANPELQTLATDAGTAGVTLSNYARTECGIDWDPSTTTSGGVG